MGCNCGKRRDLTVKAVKNISSGNLSAARQNANRFVQTLKIDARKLSRSILTTRPR